MELIIDEEYSELIPPLSEEEYNGLENNILTHGYNKKYPIIVWNNIIIDGHHRYKICKNHNIDFIYEEMNFTSRSDVIIWMIDNQKNKRNANKMTLTYLIGKQYREQKKTLGKQIILPQNEAIRTSEKLSKQTGVSHATVERAAVFSENLEKICKNTGVKKQEILLGNIKANLTEINNFVDQDAEFQIRVLNKVLIKEAKDLKEAISKVEKEYREERGKQLKEEEGKRKEELKKKLQEEIILEDEKKRIEEEQKRIEEEKNRINCKVGMWYELGEHLLYCGSNEDKQFKDKLKDYKISFVFADPPYNAGVADWDENFIWTQDWLIDISPIVAVTPGTNSLYNFMNVTKMPYVWSIACWIDNGMTRGALGFGNWIYTALFSRESVYCNSQDFLKVTIDNSSTDETTHKGRKPSELIDWFITKFTKKDNHIVDPFLGSGTTLLISEKLNRKCIGAEIIPEFCNEIIKRWESLTQKKAIIYEN